nr:hypothetical protein [Dehalococcoidia bacterium]
MNDKAVKVVFIAIASLLLLFGAPGVCSAATHSVNDLATPRSSAPVLGEQRTIVILVEFEDKKHFLSREYFVDLVFTKFNDYYREVSYNQVWLTGDVLDWVALPVSSNAYELGWAPAGQHVRAEYRRFAARVVRSVDKMVDFSQYECIIIFAAGGFVSGFHDFYPLGAYGGAWSISTDDGIFNRKGFVSGSENTPWVYLMHELSHSLLQLPDLQYHLKIPGAGPEEVTPDFFMCDRWDPMSRPSASYGIGHFCAGNKIRLGWLPPERTNVIQGGQTRTVTIDPLALQTEGIQVIKVVTATSKYYLVELRRKIGFDTYLPGEGVLITWIDETKTSRSDWAEVFGVEPDMIPYWVPMTLPPEGIWKLQDAHPFTPSLSDAAFEVGQGYVDQANNLAIVVTRQVGKSYELVVTTAADGQILLEEMKQHKRELSTAITAAEDAVELARQESRIGGLDRAETLMDEASSNYQFGKYERAVALASQARDAAQTATKPQAYY